MGPLVATSAKLAAVPAVPEKVDAVTTGMAVWIVTVRVALAELLEGRLLQGVTLRAPLVLVDLLQALARLAGQGAELVAPAFEMRVLLARGIRRLRREPARAAQAFEGLRLAGRKVRRPERTVATPDHNIPTTDRSLPIADPISRQQVETLRQNCREFGIRMYDIGDIKQGIVHVIGPELGFTQPGMTIVCGDSHTSTHGAFGALAFGIGTSEVEHVLATQCLVTRKMKNMRVAVDGPLARGVTAKDVVLAIIGRIGTAGGTGHAIEFAGSTIRAMSMEGRMTVCNMAIEAGARAGMVAVDETTLGYIKGRRFAPQGADFERAAAEAEDLVRAEPDNAVAWALLRGATSQTDPERSAEAAAELKRLNPRGVP